MKLDDDDLKEIKKEVRKASWHKFGFLSIIKLVLCIVIIGGLIYGYTSLRNKADRNFQILASVDSHDMTLENHGIFGYKAVDFSKVILGEAKRQTLLIVDEQEVSINSTITNAGFLDIGIFSKNQSVTYYGTGTYTIDLSQLTEDDISLDDSTFTVTVTVPYPELHSVAFDPNKTVVGDVDRGWLAFGDITMTSDEQKKVEEEAVKRLTEELSESDCFDKAARYAKLSATELFQPIIEQVSPAYKLNVVVAQKPVDQ